MAVKSNSVNFVVAQNSAVVLNPATSDEATVRGLQGMGLCLGFTMTVLTVSEMGNRIATKVPSGGEYDTTTVNYNFIPGDPTLTTFQDAALNSTKLTDIRLYVKQGCDFSAPDLISDPASGLYIGSFTDPNVASPNELWTGSLDYMPGGAFTLFIAHKVGTDLSYVAATRTLTTSASDFVSAGFEAGDTLILDYADSNDPLYLKAESVSTTEIVFTEDVGDEATLGDFSGISTTALHGATPQAASTAWTADC